MQIDSHQHFWRYNPDEHVWMTAAMEILKRDYLPEALKPLLEYTGIEGTIAVQARQNLQETEWLLELADEHVGFVIPASSQISWTPVPS